MPWTEITCPQHLRDKLPYASDLRNTEWNLIAPFMPAAHCLGRPRLADLRTVADAMCHIGSTGCRWRQLPKEFPPYSTVQGYFYQWRRDGRWEVIDHALAIASREQAASYP